MCSIANLDGSLEPLSLPVYGRSLMPYCHFELEPDTDYFTQRSAEDRGGFGSTGGGTVDATTTRVIQFTSCGVGVKKSKYVPSRTCVCVFSFCVTRTNCLSSKLRLTMCGILRIIKMFKLILRMCVQVFRGY